MNKRFPIVSGSSEVVSTANGTLYTENMNIPNAPNKYQVYAEFYSDAEGTTIVTPTAGTVAIAGSPLGNTYLAASNAASIDATKAGATPTYTPPVFEGHLFKGRAVFNGVTGADYARIVFWGYK